MKRWGHVFRGLLVVAFVLAALALPVGASAFVPPNPVNPTGNATSAAPSGINWAEASIAMGVVIGAGAALTGLAIGELRRPHDHGRHQPLVAS